MAGYTKTSGYKKRKAKAAAKPSIRSAKRKIVGKMVQKSLKRTKK